MVVGAGHWLYPGPPHQCQIGRGTDSDGSASGFWREGRSLEEVKGKSGSVSQKAGGADCLDDKTVTRWTPHSGHH